MLSTLFYNFIHGLLRLLFTVLFRLECRGLENIPRTGGVVIAVNHVSLLDPPLVGCTVPRPMHFMAKDALFVVPLFGWVIKQLHAFPVRRGVGDRAAIVTALNLLRQKQVVLLFPEGTISKTGELGQGKPGVAMLAAKVGVPIVSATVIGPEKLRAGGPWFPKCKIIFNKPIFPEAGNNSKQYLDDLTGAVMREIASNLPSD